MVVACATVPITGRKQTKLLPESSLNEMALTSYRQFLNENRVSTDQIQVNKVREVGQNIRGAVETFYRAQGMTNKLSGFSWEFNLVDDPTVNAWAMPGGKIVVYTGLLPIAENTDGLAVVMGHELAHALAHHGNERMSQGLLVQLGGIGLAVALSEKPAVTQALFMQAYGVAAQVGAMLPFSRLHESEADEIGLYLMAIAGYNPEEAAPFWRRMNAGAGSRPPAFLSTHPDPENRARRLQALIPKARIYAQKYGAGQSRPTQKFY